MNGEIPPPTWRSDSGVRAPVNCPLNVNTIVVYTTSKTVLVPSSLKSVVVLSEHTSCDFHICLDVPRGETAGSKSFQTNSASSLRMCTCVHLLIWRSSKSFIFLTHPSAHISQQRPRYRIQSSLRVDPRHGLLFCTFSATIKRRMYIIGCNGTINKRCAPPSTGFFSTRSLASFSISYPVSTGEGYDKRS